MKTYLIVFCLVISLNSQSQNHKNNNQNTDIGFTEFTNKFQPLRLPLYIRKLTDFAKYGDNIVKEIKGKTVIVSNPLCPSIPVNEYKYINNKYPTNKDFYYQSVYVGNFKDYVCLVIKQVNRITGDYFLKLNVHDLSGNLIDTLSLAGQKIDDYDQFCSVDSNLHIQIRKLKDLTQPPQSREPWPMLETIEEYVISNDGHFKQTYFKQEKGVFITKDNEEIRVDKSE